jgi:hypothetical protein
MPTPDHRNEVLTGDLLSKQQFDCLKWCHSINFPDFRKFHLSSREAIIDPLASNGKTVWRELAAANIE